MVVGGKKLEITVISVCQCVSLCFHQHCTLFKLSASSAASFALLLLFTLHSVHTDNMQWQRNTFQNLPLFFSVQFSALVLHDYSVSQHTLRYFIRQSFSKALFSRRPLVSVRPCLSVIRPQWKVVKLSTHQHQILLQFFNQ